MTFWLCFQAGAYLPFFRAHAHVDTKRREPWLFEDKYKNLMREAVRHRYILLPYWYTLFYEASISGVPIVRYAMHSRQTRGNSYNFFSILKSHLLS